MDMVRVSRSPDSEVWWPCGHAVGIVCSRRSALWHMHMTCALAVLTSSPTHPPTIMHSLMINSPNRSRAHAMACCRLSVVTVRGRTWIC